MAQSNTASASQGGAATEAEFRSPTISSAAQDGPCSISSPLCSDPPAPARGAPRWVPYKQCQGITLHRLVSPSPAAAGGMRGEFMACTPVRGSPGVVLAALMSGSAPATVLGPASHAQVLMNSRGTDGGHLQQVLHLVLEAQGLAGCLLAPRDWVLRLTVLREPTMHVVCFTSVDEDDQLGSHALAQTSGSLVPKPVRARARGTYAIAPLEGHSLDSSPESLICCIVKVDLRGACGEGSALEPLSRALGLQDAFLDRVLLAPLLIRDLVEHSRFVLKPEELLAVPLPGARVRLQDGARGGCWQQRGPAQHDENGRFGDGANDGALQVGLAMSAAGTASPSGVPDSPLHATPARPQHDANSNHGGSRLMNLLRSSFTRPSADASGRHTAGGHASSSRSPETSDDGTLTHSTAVRALLQATPTHAARAGNGMYGSGGGATDNGSSGQSSGAGGEGMQLRGKLDLAHMKKLASLEPRFWEAIHAPGKACPFIVRGVKYLEDRKKIPAGMAAYHLAAMDVVTYPHVIEHVARFLPSVREGRAPFSFVINLIIPGTPLLGIVSTFSSDRHPDELGTPPQDPRDPSHGWSPFDFVLHKFIYGDTATRNLMLKLIPHIADGSWVVKQSVGTTPVITGKALKTTYHMTQQYIEIDIDVSANQVASYVTGLVRGATKSLVIDIGFVLEGTKPWELPERLLGAMRVNWLDLSCAKPLDMSKGEIPLQPAITTPAKVQHNPASRFSIKENPLWDEVRAAVAAP